MRCESSQSSITFDLLLVKHLITRQEALWSCGTSAVICCLCFRLLAPRLQTGDVLGERHPRVRDAQRRGNGTGAPPGRCGRQSDAQRDDAAARGLRALQRGLRRPALGPRGQSQQPVSERTHAAALLRQRGVRGLCRAAHPQRSAGKGRMDVGGLIKVIQNNRCSPLLCPPRPPTQVPMLIRPARTMRRTRLYTRRPDLAFRSWWPSTWSAAPLWMRWTRCRKRRWWPRASGPSTPKSKTTAKITTSSVASCWTTRRVSVVSLFPPPDIFLLFKKKKTFSFSSRSQPQRRGQQNRSPQSGLELRPRADADAAGGRGRHPGNGHQRLCPYSVRAQSDRGPAHGRTRALLPAAAQPQRGADLPAPVPQGAETDALRFRIPFQTSDEMSCLVWRRCCRRATTTLRRWK